MSKDLKPKGFVTSRETITKPVSEMPTKDFLEDFNLGIVSRRAKAIIFDGKVVNFATDKYTIQTNKEILDIFEKPLKEAFGNLSIEYRQDGEARFYIDYIVKDQKIDISKGDPVHPKIRIQNSYDGTLKFGFTAGAWRLVCKNGMVVGNIDAKLKFMHTESITERIATDAVNKLSNFVENYSTYTEEYRELAKNKVILEDRVEAVMEEIKFPKKQMEAVMYRAIQEAKDLGTSMNDWIIFNAFNYQLNHNVEINLPEHKKTKLDGQILQFLSENR